MEPSITFLNRNQVPLLTSEPLHIVFRSKARVGQVAPTFYDFSINVNAGQPTPNGTSDANPRADLDPANLYAIDHFTFSADVAPEDYSSAIIDDTAAPDVVPGVPRFHLYVFSETTAPILKQPIPLAQFYQNAPFPKWRDYQKEVSDFGDQTLAIFQGIKGTNQFRGAFEARLAQTVALMGKQVITLILSLGVVEIRDERFIKAYKAQMERRRP